jgi:hypothetical protein
VVLGTVGRTGLSAAFLGNTAEQVIDHLRCDLLVLKPEQYKTPVELDDETTINLRGLMLRKYVPRFAGDFLGIHSGNKNKGPLGPVIDNTRQQQCFSGYLSARHDRSLLSAPGGSAIKSANSSSRSLNFFRYCAGVNAVGSRRRNSMPFAPGLTRYP